MKDYLFSLADKSRLNIRLLLYVLVYELVVEKELNSISISFMRHLRHQGLTLTLPTFNAVGSVLVCVGETKLDDKETADVVP